MKLPRAPKKRVEKRRQLEVELRLAGSFQDKQEIFDELVGAHNQNPPTKREQKYLDKLTDYIDEVTNSIDNTFKVFDVEAVLDGTKKDERRNFYTIDHVKVTK